MTIFNDPDQFARLLRLSIYSCSKFNKPKTQTKIQYLLQNWSRIPQEKRSYALSTQLEQLGHKIKEYDPNLATKIQKISKEVLPKNPKTLLDELCPGYREDPTEAVARLDFSQLKAFFKHIDQLDILTDQADERLRFCHNLIGESDRSNRTWTARFLVWNLEKFRIEEFSLQDRLQLIEKILITDHGGFALAENLDKLGLDAFDEGTRFRLCQEIIQRKGGRALAQNFQKSLFSDKSHRLALAKSIIEQDDWEAKLVLENLDRFELAFESDTERLAFFKFILAQSGQDTYGWAAQYLAEHMDQLGLQEVSNRVALFMEIVGLGDRLSIALFENIEKLGLADIELKERLSFLNEIASTDVNRAEYFFSEKFDQLGFIQDMQACKDIKSRLAFCRQLITQCKFLSRGLIKQFDQLELDEASFQERFAFCNMIAETNCFYFLSSSFNKLGFIKDLNKCQTTAERLTFCREMVNQAKWAPFGLIRNFNQLGLEKASIEDLLSLIRFMMAKNNMCALTLAENFKRLGLQKGKVKDRYDLCMELADYERHAARCLVNGFHDLGLETATLQKRLALCLKLVERGAASSVADNYEKLGLEGATLEERLELFRKIMAQGQYATEGLRRNFEKFGTDPEKRKMLLELLIPPHFFNKGLLNLSFLGDITPLVAVLTKEEDEGIELSEFTALGRFLLGKNLSPLVPFFEKIHRFNTPQVKFQLTQWLASCAAVLSNQSPDYHTALEKSGILDDLFHYRNPMNRFAVTKHLRTLRGMLPEAKKKKWSRISWVLLSKMQEIGFSEEWAQTILSQINHKSHSGRVFTGPARFNHLLQLLLKVIEAQPYETKEINLISQATMAILRQRGRTTQEKDAICIQLQMLTNILNLFGKEALINCLELKKDGEVFFREKLEELLEIDEMDDFGKRYQGSFGSFRDPMALFTYIRTNRELPEVLEALSVYVNGVLKEEFPAIRYATHLNPHLKMLFERDPSLKAMWLKSPIESTTLESVGAVEEVDYKQFFKNKILVDKHLNPADLPQLCSYLKTGTIVSADPFQTLAIQLCEGEIKAQDFVSRVRELPINLGEFQNDLQSLLPQRSFGQYTLSESDDPCDLLLIGTEINGSCQRVSSPASKTLVSYLMNGEIRPIVVKSGGKLIARSLLRLMWDDTNETPLLLMERIYSNVIDASVKEAIQDWAKAKAEMMQIPLVSQEVGSGAPYAGSVNFLGGFAPYVYSDASGGSLTGPFETKGCHCLFQPE